MLAYAFMTLDGAGTVVVDVLALTLLQRSVPEEVRARVFGIMDSALVAVTVAGSLMAPFLLSFLSLRVTVLIAGASLPVVALIVTPKLRALDDRAARRARELAPRVALLEGLGIFGGTSLPSFEVLAAAVAEQSFSRDDVVVREGEPADDFYVVASGELQVTSSGESEGAPKLVNSLTAGDYFGEIGLLERIPRTATVRATSNGVLCRIPGDDFIAAASRGPALSEALLNTVLNRMRVTHPSRRVSNDPTG